MTDLDKLIKGLQFFKEKGAKDVTAEADNIYVDYDPSKCTDTEIETLEELGWNSSELHEIFWSST